MITWSSPIWLYLWLAGMAGGAYFAAFLVDRFSHGAHKPLLRLATYLGIPIAVVGLILLVIDLGEPIRFWHLLARFDFVSPMSVGSWILLFWVGAAVILVILWWAESRVEADLRRATEIISWMEIVFSAFLMVYTGVLLSASSTSMWAGTWLVPVLFVVSAVSTGVALLVLTPLITGMKVIPRETIVRLAEADAVLILLELAVLVLFGVWLGASAMESLKLLTVGTLAAPFWAGVIAFGLLIPLSLELVNWGKRLEARVVLRIAMASSICVILGGLILRAVIVVGGQL
jgi:polysulfide reductase chain C